MVREILSLVLPVDYSSARDVYVNRVVNHIKTKQSGGTWSFSFDTGTAVVIINFTTITVFLYTSQINNFAIKYPLIRRGFYQ